VTIYSDGDGDGVWVLVRKADVEGGVVSVSLEWRDAVG
jgi:hypothetical protein